MTGAALQVWSMRGGQTLADAAAALVIVLPVLVWPGAWGSGPIVPAALALGAWIVWQDARTYTIPDAALAALALLAILHRAAAPMFGFDPVFAIASLALDGLLSGGSVLLVREVYFRRRGHDGIGFGDVKLAAVGGLLCGLQGFSVALLLASIGGLAVALFAKRLELGEFSRKLPFGAIFAPVLLLIWIFQA